MHFHDKTIEEKQQNLGNLITFIVTQPIHLIFSSPKKKVFIILVIVRGLYYDELTLAIAHSHYHALVGLLLTEVVS